MQRGWKSWVCEPETNASRRVELCERCHLLQQCSAFPYEVLGLDPVADLTATATAAATTTTSAASTSISATATTTSCAFALFTLCAIVKRSETLALLATRDSSTLATITTFVATSSAQAPSPALLPSASKLSESAKLIALHGCASLNASCAVVFRSNTLHTTARCCRARCCIRTRRRAEAPALTRFAAHSDTYNIREFGSCFSLLTTLNFAA